MYSTLRYDFVVFFTIILLHSLKYLSEQIFIKYEQILSTILVSLICLLYSFICLFLVILIIGKTN